MATVGNMEESPARLFSPRQLKLEPLIKPGNVLENKETFQSLTSLKKSQALMVNTTDYKCVII